MKRPLILFFLLFLATLNNIEAQKRFPKRKPLNKPAVAQKTDKAPDKAIIIDERLAVLRSAPSLFARPLQRMRRGRVVMISETRETDGVTFYRVTSVPKKIGWLQKEAVAGRLRRGDDERLARLIQASEGFEQIERAQIFLENFPASPFRPIILLLFGDLMEEIALKLSNEAARRLDRREMAATGAPLHSFYLNYSSLDRYQRLGIVFLFDPKTKLFHYNGATWREVVGKFPTTSEAAEAQKRLDSLKARMEAVK